MKAEELWLGEEFKPTGTDTIRKTKRGGGGGGEGDTDRIKPSGAANGGKVRTKQTT